MGYIYIHFYFCRISYEDAIKAVIKLFQSTNLSHLIPRFGMFVPKPHRQELNKYQDDKKDDKFLVIPKSASNNCLSRSSTGSDISDTDSASSRASAPGKHK